MVETITSSIGSCGGGKSSEDDGERSTRCGADYVFVPLLQFRRFSCDVCGRFFKANSDKKRHGLLVHGKVRPFECTECDAKFGIRGDLNR